MSWLADDLLCRLETLPVSGDLGVFLSFLRLSAYPIVFCDTEIYRLKVS